MVDSGRLFTWAWKILPKLPSPLVRGGFDLAARIAHLARIGGVQQLERNLARITRPTPRELRSQSRDGMRRYLRYYAEVFQLPRLTPAQIAARVRTVGSEPTRRALQRGTVVAGLGHLGNWDLAGAWSELNFAHVVTVAEKLTPEELFTQFLSFRENLGMRILAYEKGHGVFRELLRAARSDSALMPLLADRDLSRDGVVVTVCDEEMRVAPGPAAVAVAAGVPFVGVFIRHERLRGQRRRAAGSPWGIVIEFTDFIAAPEAIPAEERAAHMMQMWADRFGAFLRAYPQDWHMLQKCFVADLDETRLARASRGAFGEGE